MMPIQFAGGFRLAPICRSGAEDRRAHGQSPHALSGRRREAAPRRGIQTRSLVMIPSAAARRTQPAPAIAIDQRRSDEAGDARVAAPARPRVAPANVSTAWKATPVASDVPRPMPLPSNASVAAPAPAPKFPEE